jgi:hypothetical protein
MSDGVVSLAATGKYYIISGQHRFVAAQAHAKMATDKYARRPTTRFSGRTLVFCVFSQNGGNVFGIGFIQQESRRWGVQGPWHTTRAVTVGRRALAAQAPPTWTQKFRAKLIKQDASVTVRQIIAGKTQAAQDSSHVPSLSDRLRWLRFELETLMEDAASRGEEATVNKSSLLRETYIKTACRPEKDGSMVCP